jgi:hypothetical protein
MNSFRLSIQLLLGIQFGPRPQNLWVETCTTSDSDAAKHVASRKINQF